MTDAADTSSVCRQPIEFAVARIWAGLTGTRACRDMRDIGLVEPETAVFDPRRMGRCRGSRIRRIWHCDWDVAHVAARGGRGALGLRGEVAAEGIYEVHAPIALERFVVDTQVARPDPVGPEQTGEPARAEPATAIEVAPGTLFDRRQRLQERLRGQLRRLPAAEHLADVGQQPDAERDPVCFLLLAAKRDECCPRPVGPATARAVGDRNKRLACILRPVVELVGKLRPSCRKLLEMRGGELFPPSAELFRL